VLPSLSGFVEMRCELSLEDPLQHSSPWKLGLETRRQHSSFLLLFLCVLGALCGEVLCLFGLLGHLSVKLVGVDDKALMGGLADLVHLVEAFHLVGKLLAVNFN